MKKLSGIVLCIAIASLPGFGSAVYSNLNDASTSPSTVSVQNQDSGTEFLTPPSITELSGITLTLTAGTPVEGDQLGVYFFLDSNTGTYAGCSPNCPVPGTYVEQAGYVPYSTLISLSTTPTNVPLTMTAFPELPPSTDLWMVVESEQLDADDANVVLSQNATNGTDGGSNATFQSLYHDVFGDNSWSHYDALNSAYPATIPEMEIDVVFLPEPATVALFGVSLTCLGLLHRRWRVS